MRKTNNFLWKNLLFSLIWIIGILVVFARVDILILNELKYNIEWLEEFLPLIIITLVLLIMLTQKWYYNLALFCYPLLALFWFIPKFILNNGKIYFLIKYINYIFYKFKNYKKTLFQIELFIVTIILLLMISNDWVKWFAICTACYFYISYLWEYLKNSFSQATIFGYSFENFINDIIFKEKNSESFLISAFLLKSDNTKFTVEELKNKNLINLIKLNYTLNEIINRLNGFNRKTTYVTSLIYQLLIFIFFTILFFSFVNFQLFQINNFNFEVTGIPTGFDFIYYTVKCMTFNGIDSIIPATWITKIIEMMTYILISILILGIISSLIFSLKNEKISENINLTTSFLHQQNIFIIDYVNRTYGKDIKDAIKEVANIQQSLIQLQNYINKFL
ncbi:MAG: hypothetical protein RO257_11100 [Candidatus Kapabacteria bacterium]|nr:hypothetical protein [Candidatus Kapabacteria bacterium]